MKKYIMLIALFTACLGLKAHKYNYDFLIGTFTKNTSSEGIYSLHFNTEINKIEVKLLAKNTINPSYLAFSKNKKTVYCVNESGEQSKVSAYDHDSKKNSLHLINTVNAGAQGPCFIAASSKHVITGNYTGGSLSVFAKLQNGALSEIIQLIQHKGSSIDKSRQTTPHVHQTIFSKDYKYLLVNDLGTDYLIVYLYNSSANSVVLTPFDSLKVKVGSGPRHLTFNKKGNIIYLLQELDGTLSVISFKNGKLKLIQETTVIQKSGLITAAADIHVSPDGKFVYATNRGTANDISCFKIAKNGTISFVHQISTKGDGPRNFTITTDGKYLLVANQRTNNIVVFKRNFKTGALVETGMYISVPAPVCLKEF